MAGAGSSEKKGVIGYSVPLFLGLTLLLALTCLIAVGIGPVHIPLQEIWQAFRSLFSGDINALQREHAILFSIRLPRILLSALVGGSLAISGAALQGLFRNPLAEPGLIGISTGGALGAAIMIVLGGGTASMLGVYSLSLAAFLGCLVAAYTVFRFATIGGSSSVMYMLLAGIAVNAIASAGTGFLAFLSNDQQLRQLTFWTLGSFGGATWFSVAAASSIILPVAFLLQRYGRALNLLMLGEEQAFTLGLSVENAKRRIIVLVALGVGAAVSVSGIISFIGLIVPHVVRMTLGADHRGLIPASCLLGAWLAVVADTLARTMLSPADLPVGIITSLIGGPYFLWLLMQQLGRRV